MSENFKKHNAIGILKLSNFIIYFVAKPEQSEIKYKI